MKSSLPCVTAQFTRAAFKALLLPWNTEQMLRSQELAALQLTVPWVALPFSAPAPGVTKGKVLFLSQGNPQNQYRTTEGMESSPAKDLGTGQGLKNWT